MASDMMLLKKLVLKIVLTIANKTVMQCNVGGLFFFQRRHPIVLL
jgi:hypothetical protein